MSDTLNFVLARPNDAADHIEQLEAALRYYAIDDDPHFDRARAALARSSSPARQENDDVYPGFRGNNEA